ncbi:MAG: hypothetical protein U0235_23790 [Polyangiaceae bacterium]
MKVRIPELVLAAARTEAPPPKGPAAASGGSSALRTVGYVTLGSAWPRWSRAACRRWSRRGALADAKAACETVDALLTESTAPNDRAKTWSTVATFATVSSAVLGAAGVVVIVWPRSRATRFRVGGARRRGGLPHRAVHRRRLDPGVDRDGEPRIGAHSP